MSAAPESTNAACPVCNGAGAFFFAHPDADVYRCPGCTHTYSRLDTVRVHEVYDERYYEETHSNWFAHPNFALFEWIEARIPARAQSILDVGCGNGDLLRFVRKRRPVARLVGIDLSDAAPTGDFERVRADVTDTDALAEKFDAVTSLAVIEHVPDIAAFAHRLAELCTPGGTVIVMTLNANGLLYRFARGARRVGVSIASDRLYSSHHLHHFTPESLRRLLASAGLEMIEIHHHNTPLAALDLPATSPAVRVALTAGVATTFRVGAWVNSCYLQTIVCRRLPGA